MSAEEQVKRILIVDDDANIRRFLTESLRLQGYEVEHFSAAEPALEQLHKQTFDLALLDILLPGTNGLHLCEQIRARYNDRDLPVIMMTAFYRQADHVREAREKYGATDYLLKPFPIKDLHAKIEHLIGASVPDNAGSRLNIEGELSETPFPRILHNLYSLKATGLLHVEYNTVKKAVYVLNGYPIFARSNLVREFLGQILLRESLLNEANLEHSLNIAREAGKRHGSVLIEMGLLSETQLQEILRQQVIDKLLDIFSWQGGKYRFVQAREFKQGVTRIDLSPANLILQGLRSHASAKQLATLLEPSTDLYLEPAENPLYRFQEIQLSRHEQKIFDHCHGQLTQQQILQRFPLSRRESEAVLAALLCTGILVGRKDPAPVAAAVEQSASAESPEVAARRKAFLKDYNWMMEQDFFTLLGVTEADGKEQIRKSYVKLVKRYHPDRFFEEGMIQELKDKVNDLFQRISEAHETLIDPAAKARYVNDLKGLNDNRRRPTFDNILEAEAAFQQGRTLFRHRNYREALEAFNQALELGPEETEYLLYQAWSAYKVAPHDRYQAEQTRQKLTRVVQRNPKLALAHLYLGYLHKEDGNLSEAVRRFEKTIQLDPNCTEALRELRLIRMRQETPSKGGGKGLLGKVFNK